MINYSRHTTLNSLHVSTFCLVVLLCVVSIPKSWAQPAAIASFEPKTAFAGQTVNIRGANFQAGARVIFGATEANVISVSDQLIEAEVPPGATVRRISVINPSGFTAYSNQNFVLSFNGDTPTTSASFTSQIDLPAETGLFDVCMCDIDGDGLNDLFSGNSEFNIASVFQNISTPGTISFAKIPVNLMASTLNTACGDLNGDGKPELIFSEGDDGERLFILINNSIVGSFSFSLRTINIPGNSTKRIEINDLNLDGRPELIVTDQASNQVSILRNTTTSGNLNFDLSNIIRLDVPGAESSAGMVVEDIDGDRRPDIVINQFLRDGGGIYSARNIGTGNNIDFTTFELNDVPGTYVNLALKDIDGDGSADLLGTRFLNGTLNVLLNQSSNGSIQWSAPTPFVVNGNPWGVELGDLDGDRLVDVVVTSLRPGSTNFTVLNNQSTPGNLSLQRVDIPVTFINRNAKVGDIDGDGRPDVVITSVDDDANNIPSSDVSILRNINCIVPLIEPEGPINFC
ncbi:MAG: FG-GAP-like repeat-containing protein [Bacteroidota bacterium]